MPHMDIYLTKWLWTEQRGDVVALYHKLNMELFFVSARQWSSIIEPPAPLTKNRFVSVFGESFYESLVESGLLISTPDADTRQFEELRSCCKNQFLQLMYLLVTDGCNLKCTYCFEESPDSPVDFAQTQMSEHTAIAAVDYFVSLTKKYGTDFIPRAIHLYGGEPLLNKRVVRAAITHVRKIEPQHGFERGLEIIIVTNGLLLDEETAQFLVDNDVTVAISLDGPETIHNRYRRAKNERINTYAGARKAFQLMQHLGGRTGVSVTLTKETIREPDKLAEFLTEDVGVASIGFNILHYNPSMPGDDDYYNDAADFLLEVYPILRDKGVFEERMFRKVNAFVNKKPIYADCGVVGNQIVVAPDGSVGVCHDFVKPRQYFEGSVLDPTFDPFAGGLFDGWQRRSPLYMDECLNCEAIAVCGGGCPASIELSSGSRWNVDTRICPHSKKTLSWLIWETYRNLGVETEAS